jgi:ribulose-phosphate 3-epimerase
MPQCCINPSILSADFVNLEAELQRISNADSVHVDVMDNHFVPNLTLGLPVVQRIQAVSPVPLDAHLMISDADRWAPGYADAGVASVTFHAEASIAPVKLARELRARRILGRVRSRNACPPKPSTG